MNKKLDFEAAVKRLEQIVAALEKNEASLDESIKLFQEGCELAAFCNERLTDAKQKITEISKD